MPLTSAQRKELAERYAPVLVIFPEREDLGRPYGPRVHARGIRGDYHPRSADLVLDRAYLFPGHPQALKDQLRRLDTSSPLIRGLPWPLYNRFPQPRDFGQEAFYRALRDLPARGRAAVLDIVDIRRGPPAPVNAWRAYHRLVRGNPQRYHRTVYARIVEPRAGTVRQYLRSTPLDVLLQGIPVGQPPFRRGPGDVALQYWFLYFYNDWANRHEVDWEGITLILTRRDPAGALTPENLEPVMAGYSSHESGRRRPWISVEKEGERPVVYVARGSHASYFEYREFGYVARLPIGIRIPYFNIILHLDTEIYVPGRTDRVPPRGGRETMELWPAGAAMEGSQVAGYELVFLPEITPATRLDDLDDGLKWLLYAGLWGDRPLIGVAGSGPKGPFFNGLKSLDPFQWVARTCSADDTYSP